MISSFTKEYFFLSNFYLRTFRYKLRTYKSAEHAFQAAKTNDPEQRRMIQTARTPLEAKRLGRSVTLRQDWEDQKRIVMAGVVAAKFAYNDDLMQRLIETGNLDLVEGNDWRDTFWGAVWMSKEDPDMPTWAWDGNCPLVGHNHLGRILMHIRGID